MKKSGDVPGPGIAFWSKIALCRKVIAWTIWGLVKPQVRPSSLHASAPHPPHTVARLSHAL